VAERFFIRALNIQMPPERRQAILQELADLYTSRQAYSKLAAVYEKWIELYPRNPEVPGLYFRLGRLYRQIGAYQTAIARFYSILNYALAWYAKDMDATRQLVHEAQWEIAQTYFVAGNYQAASTFLTRLERMVLSDTEREQVHFQIAYCLHANGLHPGALEKLEAFIVRYPSSPHLPEAYFMMASSLKALNKNQEAMVYVRELIKLGLSQTGLPEEQLRYWQQRTGNHVANLFYDQGDYPSALKIYQAMLAMRSDMEWQWPVIYQIGLCFERLGLYNKAYQAYGVIREGKEWASDPAQWPAPIQSLYDLACWRQDHMVWLMDVDQRMDRLLEHDVDLPPAQAPAAPQAASADSPSP
jgi:tetratricopeptide (TPR) repeat protein